MQTIIWLLQEYGYWIVFLGAVVEGESIILPASAMASQGILNVYNVAMIAFFTTLFVDQLVYFVGYRYGHKIFRRFPKLKPAADRGFRLLHKYDVWYILTFRFIYGLRTISPIVIGTAKVPPRKYIPLNFIAAVIWTVISVGGGYMLGDVMMDVMKNFELGQKYFFKGLLLLVIFLYGGPYVYRKWFRKENRDRK